MAQPSTIQLRKTALLCRSYGIIPIPTNDKKRAVTKWRNYSLFPPTEQETLRTFGFSFTKGIAVLCGPISGNLEVIDVDTKYDLTGELMRQYCLLVKKQAPTLLPKLVIQKTRSGGYHLMYRCDAVERNQLLARRPATPEELAQNPGDKVKVLIETRATKGIACISPTPGYQFIRGDLSTIQTIIPEERTILLSAARSFNQVLEEEKLIRRPFRPVIADTTTSPIDEFNRKGDVIELLKLHGWSIADDRNPEKTYLLRPGDTDKDSSGNYNYRLKLFSTFSTSTVFQAEKGYSPAGVFIQLECGGNRHEGVKELLRRGYGVSYVQQREMARIANRR